MKWDNRTYRVTDSGRVAAVAYSIGAVGLVLSLVAFFVDRGHFFHSWLVAFTFWTTLGLGGLFFVMLHHLSGSTWSVVLRRIAETLMGLLPLMILPALVLLLNLKGLYHWADAGQVAADPLLQHKASFLNPAFFMIRTIGYFAVWTALVLMLRRTSLAQDNGHTERIGRRFNRLSAPGMILFAVTCTLAAFDWLMSLDAHWYSTIFGVYVFAGAAVTVVAVIIITVVFLRSRGVLKDTVTIDHYHDLGKLLFAFVIFWAYMAFSQYFLIWYGNIPEETVWFLHRWEGWWKGVSLLLVFGHFVFPFLALFPYAVKGRPGLLAGIAGWLLLMHWVDIYWLVMPGGHPGGGAPSWIDLGVMMMFTGSCVGWLWRMFTSRPMVPTGDPALGSSIHPQHRQAE